MNARWVKAVEETVIWGGRGEERMDIMIDSIIKQFSYLSNIFPGIEDTLKKKIYRFITWKNKNEKQHSIWILWVAMKEAGKSRAHTKSENLYPIFSSDESINCWSLSELEMPGKNAYNISRAQKLPSFHLNCTLA